MTTTTPDPMREALTRDLNALRAAASRGPVSSREIFQLTDPMMDRLSRAALTAAPQPATSLLGDFLNAAYDLISRWHIGVPIVDEIAKLEKTADAVVRDRAAAQQPANGDFVSDEYDTAGWADPRDKQPVAADREALVEVIYAASDAYIEEHDRKAIADALLADGWRRADQAALDAAYRKGQEDMRERAAAVAQEKHDAVVRWASHYLQQFDGKTDSLLIAQEIRALSIQGGDDAA